METIMALSSRINGLVWGIPMLVLMVGCGIFMSSRLGFVQFRRFGYTMRNTLGKMFDKTEVEDGALSPVQAMTTALAGTVGTGSIAGVAGAIALGGPGAVFWMWVAALFGMCTKFSEITLAVRYREKNEDGEWIGGPMYYIKNGLGKHWKWLGGLFAFFAACAAFGTGNMAQINTIATSIGSIFKAFDPAFTDAQLKTVYIVVGVAGAALTALVLFGGMKRIGAVTEKLVPVMALAYVACTAIVVFGHIGQIGFVFRQIFQGAFNPSAIGGGMAGAAILAVAKAGIGRGVFSNEAGLGTAPIAHASANVKHPVQQGIFGIFEVFTATFVICTMTALAILMSGMAPQFYGKSAGTDLTILAFGTTMGTKIASIVNCTEHRNVRILHHSGLGAVRCPLHGVPAGFQGSQAVSGDLRPDGIRRCEPGTGSGLADCRYPECVDGNPEPDCGHCSVSGSGATDKGILQQRRSEC